MTRVLVYGGLGNQMFQYALKVALNAKGIPAEISVARFFYQHHHSGFALTRAFQIRLPFPLNFYDSILQGSFLYKNSVARYFLKRLIPAHHQRSLPYYEKKEFTYDENVFQHHHKVLIGIWQAEQYFKDIPDMIKDAFTFNKPTDSLNKKLIEEIESTDSVSVHVRRGDYLNNQWASSHAVIKDKAYYINCFRHINSRVANPRYYIFSDDMKWAKENLKIPGCTFVNHNKGKNAYIDMYLMSICRHNIIANSTFSWWGAWLNANRNKMVMMPERWLNDDLARGLFPDGWVRVSV